MSMKFIEENKNVIVALLVACLFLFAFLLSSPFIPRGYILQKDKCCVNLYI